MSAHTPGPWSLNVTTMDIESTDICMGDDGRPQTFYTSICTMSGNEREDADGRLIAAAPELAEALAALGVIGAGYCFCARERDPEKAVHESECRNARAALAKAGL